MLSSINVKNISPKGYSSLKKLGFLYVQTTSRRLAERKVEKFQKNITKRGVVSETSTKKGKDYPVGPVLLGFFVFVVIGSCKILGS